MADPVWPSTMPLPDEGVEEEFYKPQRKMEFEANYGQTGPRATRGRRRFPLAWNYLSETDFQTLEAFFNTNQGSSFTYTHPIRSTTHTCVFATDSIKHKWRAAGGVAEVKCPIEEL